MSVNIRYIVAIDLGASSGRVMLARYEPATHALSLIEIHRFVNKLVQKEGHDCWDLDEIEKQIRFGLHKLEQQNITIDSIGIDTWGVDYVLLDKEGNRVGPSYAYRDHRTDGVMEKVQQELGKRAIYQKTGIQFLPFNTLYQLKAMVDEKPDWLNQVTDWVMIPDYLVYRLTGQLNREYTNATTTQLVNVQTDNWDDELIAYLGLPKSWFGTLRHPGHEVGYWQNSRGEKIPVISVASHDTASAVIATPLQNEHSAYLCSGTWSLMGLDRLHPCQCETALTTNITNEGGIDGHYRVLKNIMGLWLFQRLCQEHQISDITALLAEVEQLPAFTWLIHPNEHRFINPISMTKEIQLACQQKNIPIPKSITELTRCVFDSLALLYRQVAKELAQLHQYPLTQLHIVGGGSQNKLLNQLCADACQLPVSAGPVEASTLGNVGCQLIALNELPDVNAFHQVIQRNFPLQHFTPQPLSAQKELHSLLCSTSD